MSHATVICALDGRTKEVNLERAVSRAMRPFDENGAGRMFANGTRWDWYQIGGRWSGGLGGSNSLRRQYVKKRDAHAFAFLDQHGVWHENHRMGWWCEKAAPEKRLPKNIKQYNVSDEEWSSGYFERFIEKLKPNTWLVLIDYHV